MGKEIIAIKQVIENEVVMYEAHSRNTEKLKMTKAVVEASAAALEEQCREQERAAREAEGETALGRELEAVRRAGPRTAAGEGRAGGRGSEAGGAARGQQVVERETEERRAEVARQECLELKGDTVQVVRVTQEDVAELELELEVAAPHLVILLPLLHRAVTRWLHLSLLSFCSLLFLLIVSSSPSPPPSPAPRRWWSC